MQCERIALLTPPGFQTAAFVETVLRILGVGEAEARHMGRRFAANPAWFFGVPREDGNAESTAVVWSTKDRVLAVVGKVSRERAVEVAEAIQ